MKFAPVFKDYVWGGRNLERLLRRELPPGRVAESWEIAAHRDGTTRVANGDLKGMTLPGLFEALGPDLVGSYNQRAAMPDRFPLLVKLLDANEHLSVQVHPTDDYAQEHEADEVGKTEMWVVLHAVPNAAIVLGLRRGTTRQIFQQALEQGELSPLLHRIPISKGDVVCIPSGSIHAILKGSVLAEIQQNSNATYRVFDWNRVQGGSARQLHIGQAMDVINFDQIEPGISHPLLLADAGGVVRSRLCSNPHFVCEKLDMGGGASFSGVCNGSTLEIWGTIEGRATINRVGLEAVQFTLLPAAMGSYEVRAVTPASLLRVYLQDSSR